MLTLFYYLIILSFIFMNQINYQLQLYNICAYFCSLTKIKLH